MPFEGVILEFGEVLTRVADASVSAGVTADLIDADFQSWSDDRPEVSAIAATLRARGWRRTALLSNGVVEIVARLI